MGKQVVRVESYGKGDLAGIGGEQLRGPQTQCKNSEIDRGRTHLNTELIAAEGTLAEAWERCMQEMNAVPYNRKGKGAFQQMLITSGQEWFAERFGWDPKKPVLTDEMRRWAQESVAWAVSQIGYHGTAANIMAATLHLDESTPHIHISYIPATDMQRRKVLQKDADGKVMRNAKGSALSVRDPETGRTKYELIRRKRPRVAKTDFWSVYGGAQSEAKTGRAGTAFCLLQDSYYINVGKAWGLERGERGSGRRHKTIYQHQVDLKKLILASLERKTARAQQDAKEARQRTAAAKAEKAKQEAASRTARQEELRSRAQIKANENQAAAIIRKARQEAAQEAEARTSVLDQREEQVAAREEDSRREEARLRERESLQSQREQEWVTGSQERIREFESEAAGVRHRLLDMTVAVDQGRRLEELGRQGFRGKWVYTAAERKELIGAAVTGLANAAAARSAVSLAEELRQAELALRAEKNTSAEHLAQSRRWEEKAGTLEAECSRLQGLAEEAEKLRDERDRLQTEKQGLRALVCGLLGVLQDTQKHWERMPVLAGIYGQVEKWLAARANKLQLKDQAFRPTPEASPASLVSHIRMQQAKEQKKAAAPGQMLTRNVSQKKAVSQIRRQRSNGMER